MVVHRRDGNRDNVRGLLQSLATQLDDDGLSTAERLRARRRAEGRYLYESQLAQRAWRDEAHGAIDAAYAQRARPPPMLDRQPPVYAEPFRPARFRPDADVSEAPQRWPFGLGDAAKTTAAAYGSHQSPPPPKRRAPSCSLYERGVGVQTNCTERDFPRPAADPAPWRKEPAYKHSAELEPPIVGKLVAAVKTAETARQHRPHFVLRDEEPVHAGRPVASELLNVFTGAEVRHQGVSCTPADLGRTVARPDRNVGSHDKSVDHAAQPWLRPSAVDRHTDPMERPSSFASMWSRERREQAGRPAPTAAPAVPARAMSAGARRFNSRPVDTLSRLF